MDSASVACIVSRRRAFEIQTRRRPPLLAPSLHSVSFPRPRCRALMHSLCDVTPHSAPRRTVRAMTCVISLNASRSFARHARSRRALASRASSAFARARCGGTFSLSFHRERSRANSVMSRQRSPQRVLTTRETRARAPSSSAMTRSDAWRWKMNRHHGRRGARTRTRRRGDAETRETRETPRRR